MFLLLRAVLASSLLLIPAVLSPPSAHATIPGFPCYRTIAETHAAAQALAAADPTLAALLDIGDSWEKSPPGGSSGHDLWVLRLTAADPAQDDPPTPKLFVVSGLHPRELAPPELSLRFAEELVGGYDVDPEITALLNSTEVHFLFLANPDGRVQAESGLLWHKNTNENYCGALSSNRGADLDANFSFLWGCCGGSSGSECDTTYRGTGPASEPETQGIESYLRFLFPDARAADLESPADPATPGLFLDLHSVGELVLWPWGLVSSPAPNGIALQTLGRRVAFENGYLPEQAVGLRPVDGAFDSPIETVSTDLDSSSLALGRHILYVRGQDADGNWGPTKAVFIQVPEPRAGMSFGPVVSALAGVAALRRRPRSHPARRERQR